MLTSLKQQRERLPIKMKQSCISIVLFLFLCTSSVFLERITSWLPSFTLHKYTGYHSTTSIESFSTFQTDDWKLTSVRFHRSDDYGDNPYEEYADFAMDNYPEIPVHKGIFDNSGLEQLVAAVSVNIKRQI